MSSANALQLPTNGTAHSRTPLNLLREEAKTTPQHTESSVTELVLTQHSTDHDNLILPMIAHFSRTSERWITWITDAPVDIAQVKKYDVDTRKLRIIRTNNTADARWMAWEALNNGTSHTVIAALGHINKDELHHLKNASHQGGSHGLFISYR